MTDLEDRLRDAFAARAELVTPQSLRHHPPPPARRLSRWVVPGVTALAVAATAAGVLVVTAPPGTPSRAPRHPRRRRSAPPASRH